MKNSRSLVLEKLNFTFVLLITLGLALILAAPAFGGADSASTKDVTSGAKSSKAKKSTAKSSDNKTASAATKHHAIVRKHQAEAGVTSRDEGDDRGAAEEPTAAALRDYQNRSYPGVVCSLPVDSKRAARVDEYQGAAAAW